MDQGDQHRTARKGSSGWLLIVGAMVVTPILGCFAFCGLGWFNSSLKKYRQKSEEVASAADEISKSETTASTIPAFDYDTPILERLEHVKTGMSEETMLKIMPVPLNKCREPYDEHSSEPSTITYTWDQGEECDLVRVDVLRGEVTFKTGKNRCGQEHLASREQNMKLYGTQHLCTFADVEPEEEGSELEQTITPLSKKASRIRIGMSLRKVKGLLGEPIGSCIETTPPTATTYSWDNGPDCAHVEVEFRDGIAVGWDEGRQCGSTWALVREEYLATRLKGTCEDKP